MLLTTIARVRETGFSGGLIQKEAVALLRANLNLRRPAAQTCGGALK